MGQLFPPRAPLIDFTDAECRAMHIACMSPHNVELIAEIQEGLPLFYADSYHGGAFRGSFNGIRFYREPAPDFFGLLSRIAENEIRNFANTSGRCVDFGWIQQEHWRALSSSMRKLSAVREAARRRAH